MGLTGSSTFSIFSGRSLKSCMGRTRAAAARQPGFLSEGTLFMRDLGRSAHGGGPAPSVTKANVSRETCGGGATSGVHCASGQVPRQLSAGLVAEHGHVRIPRVVAADQYTDGRVAEAGDLLGGQLKMQEVH